MATTLTALPQGLYNPMSRGSDIMNLLVQDNSILASALGDEPFTTENFVQKASIIINNENLVNQVYYELIDKIGLTYVATSSFYNKLNFLKKDALNNGDIVEEIQIDAIEPITYNPEINWQMAFKQYLPQMKTAFHKLNRAQVYPLTRNTIALKRAMRTEGAFANFIGEYMTNPTKSNQMDEFAYFGRAIYEIAENNAFPVEVGIPATTATYDEFLAIINTYAMNLGMPSRDYNMLGFKRTSDPQDLMFVTTPEILAHIQKLVKAKDYNLEFSAILADRTVTVSSDMLPENCLGLLCDTRCAQIYDVLYATDSNHNGLTMEDNIFLHVQQIISVSGGWNSVAFYTVVSEPTQVVFTTTAQTVAKGSTLLVEATSQDATSTIGYQHITYSISGQTDENTKITTFGLLYIGQNEQASTITVTATNYLGASATLSITVKGNDATATTVTAR